MVPEERKDKLLELLKEKKFLSVKEVAKYLFISEPTARRDISDLANLKLVKKVYGGVGYIEQDYADSPAVIRNAVNLREKILISKKAAKLIHDGMNIFIHTGTTCLKLTEFLDESINLNVLTDDIKIAYGFSKFPNVKVELTPGFLRSENDCVYGDQASQYINQRNADLFFFSCHTFDFNRSPMTCNENDIGLVRSFIENSDKTALLIDHSKFGKASFYQLCQLGDLDYIVSDYDPTEEELKCCEMNEIKFIC